MVRRRLDTNKAGSKVTLELERGCCLPCVPQGILSLLRGDSWRPAWVKSCTHASRCVFSRVLWGFFALHSAWGAHSTSRIGDSGISLARVGTR